jgi:hypothetical protein
MMRGGEGGGVGGRRKGEEERKRCYQSNIKQTFLGERSGSALPVITQSIHHIPIAWSGDDRNKEMVQDEAGGRRRERREERGGERREERGGKGGREEGEGEEGGGRRFTSTNIKRGECSGSNLSVIPQIIHYVTIAWSGDVLK